MKIFAKKCFKLEIGGQQFLTRPWIFDDMPAAFAKSMLFQWAVKDGDIEVVGNTEKQRELENTSGKSKAAHKLPLEASEPK